MERVCLGYLKSLDLKHLKVLHLMIYDDARYIESDQSYT